MKWQLRLFFLVANLACGVDVASADDSFLNREAPRTWAWCKSPKETLQVLRAVVPKTIIMPGGMPIPNGNPLLNPTEAEVKTAGSGYRFDPDPGDKKPFTVRDFLNDVTKYLELTWSYDATRDAVVLDFAWRVNDARSNEEVLETLLKTVPPEDEKHVGSRAVDPTDSWRVAFNALLSKPENYSKGGQMRWEADAICSFMFLEQPVNLFTGKVLDEAGAVHFLILNTKHPLDAPSDTIISFYLFSEAGKFEHGGLFYSEDRYGFTKATVSTDQKRLIVRNGPSPVYNQYEQVFAVEKDRLIFKDHLTNGKSTPPPNTSKYFFEVAAD